MALTNVCDLLCPYCYAPKNSRRLDTRRVMNWLRELDQNGCLGVGFGGGEPTLFPGFAALCSQAAAETRMAITFTTHGHALTEAMAGQLSGSIHFLRVSVDGVGATYERLRRRPFARLRDQLGLVRSIARFGVNTVVNEDTIGELEAVRAFAESEGASELLLLPEQATRRSGIDGATLHRLEEWIARTSRSMRLTISEAGTTEGMHIADPFGREHPLEAHAHVDASGILRANAYARVGVPVDDSMLSAVEALRDEMERE
jgi:MoaA/NifB/PqqE/SkfB family radical SAM enzyme